MELLSKNIVFDLQNKSVASYVQNVIFKKSYRIYLADMREFVDNQMNGQIVACT